MLFSAKIADLQKQITALTSERDTLAASNAQLSEANQTCETRYAADQETILALTGERDGLKTQVDELTAKLGKVETTIDSKVVEKISEAGVPAINRDANTGGDDKDGAALYAQYEQLTGRERTAFFREHGAALEAYAATLD